MKIKELINYGKNFLEGNNIEEASLKSKCLAEYILEMNRMDLTINEDKEVNSLNKDRYYLALIEMVQGTPLQYITNNQEFMKLNFYVDENVLIPQPDTEILVEEVIRIGDNIVKEDGFVKILDMCTGSGCIGTSLANYVKNIQVTMSDISINALKIAENNYKKNIGRDAIIIHSNMFENINDTYDIIVSNPPYIETNIIDTLSEEVRKEPYIALDGGIDGLDFYKILINEAPEHLNDNGYLCMEIGYNQKESVEKLVKEKGMYTEIYTLKDLSGNDRVVICKKGE